MSKRRTAPGAVSNVAAPVPETGQHSISVLSISRFAGVHQVTWHDGRQRRKILVAIERWSEADQTVIDAVAKTYPPDDRPQVVVPVNAWR
jgi:hypothetical protein